MLLGSEVPGWQAAPARGGAGSASSGWPPASSACAKTASPALCASGSSWSGPPSTDARSGCSGAVPGAAMSASSACCHSAGPTE